jgi:hypothetical protein
MNVSSEVDPFGKNPHQSGAKLDAHKLQADLLLDFRDALLAVASISDFGARKYTRHGWIDVPNGQERYMAALLRHLLQEGNDPDSGLPHKWHALWNLLAVVQLDINSASETPSQ